MSRNVDDSFDVAVVGLGPAGSVCAAMLGSLGLKTIAIEREQAVYDKPRAFALDHEVMRVFEDLGIALSRMEVISYGESQPITDNKTRDNRAENRRVVIKVLE